MNFAKVKEGNIRWQRWVNTSIEDPLQGGLLG